MNDRIAEHGEPEGTRKPDEARQESHLRVVYSSDAPASRHDAAPSTAAGQPASSGAREAMLDRALQARIGGLLREAFGDVAQAPVPDRFVKLLEALAKKKSGGHE
ncbi:MAG: NepR family anti-sigma factor [Hyphomicrobiaceae bacterium]|nr:NepR family anti-sigma factor [Hyphomicrobiaceae bacterium]